MFLKRSKVSRDAPLSPVPLPPSVATAVRDLWQAGAAVKTGTCHSLRVGLRNGEMRALAPDRGERCGEPAAALSAPALGRSSSFRSPVEPPTPLVPLLPLETRPVGAEICGAGCRGVSCSLSGTPGSPLLSRLAEAHSLAGPGRDEAAARLPCSHDMGKFAAPLAPGGARQPGPVAASAVAAKR